MERAELGLIFAERMRAALTRLELLSSQLLREGGTPRSRRLARSIARATADLETLVSRSAALLSQGREGARPDADLRSLVGELRERLSSALEAAGLIWTDAAVPEDPVHGDPAVARRAALLLLRIATARVDGSGRVRLALVTEPQGWALEVRVGPVDPDLARSEPPELVALLAEHPLGFEREPLGDGELLRLRMGGGAPCAGC